MPTRPIREIVAQRKLVSAPPELTVREAAGVMARERVGALPVLEGGRLIGIFTERDALFRVLARGLDPESTRLAQVMTPDPVTVAAERPLNHALHLMYDGAFRHVPVVDAGRVVGVVSARDALGPEMAQFEAELEQRNQLSQRM